ncbi:hypothetical protein [Thomasclavelia cocleata]|uniref:hypothetical protein n=1 Tax=Thomasclavelia cocleata TaxID=69824 RepID=UPI00256EA9D4|nr:hypothetical protein [Thomasclavelia cocleata]
MVVVIPIREKGETMTIKSFVGGHSVMVIEGATFDPSIRKFRGGEVALEIPFSGRMLSAKAKQETAEPIVVGGVSIPTKTRQIWESVDPLPSTEECDLCIVSAMYVAACRDLGIDTSRLLTMDGTVVDDDGKIRGVTGFTRN